MRAVGNELNIFMTAGILNVLWLLVEAFGILTGTETQMRNTSS